MNNPKPVPDSDFVTNFVNSFGSISGDTSTCILYSKVTITSSFLLVDAIVIYNVDADQIPTNIFHF
jgi:hypothetical protein